jgi:hypothetical protein
MTVVPKEAGAADAAPSAKPDAGASKETGR